jgi:outer membrane lipoprotein-sorting protein
MKSFFLFLSILLAGLRAGAQDLKAELRNSYEKYAHATSFHADFEVRVDLEGAQKPNYFERGTMSRLGMNTYYTVGHITALQNGAYNIMLLRDRKVILVKKRRPVDEPADYDASAFLAGIDTLIAGLDRHVQYKYLGTVDGARHYRIFLDQGEFSRVDLHLNAKTQFLKKIEYTYNPAVVGQAGTVTTTFRNVTTTPAFTAETFAESRLIVRKKDGFQPAAAYKAYQVLEINDKF